MNLGIVGCGIVGNALLEYYRRDHTVWVYDKAQQTDTGLNALNAHAEIAFICVGTPLDPSTGLLDCSQVYAAVDALTGEKTVIIKSTVLPGTTDAIQKAHPEHRLFFVPEFLSADTAVVDYANPRRPHIVGVTGELDNSFPDELLPDLDRIGRWFMNTRQAELVKLATNSLYYAKVMLMNQLYDVGLTQDALNALGTDPWIGHSHNQIVHKQYRGAAGACLVKDTLTMIGLGNACGSHPTMFQAADEYNKRLLHDRPEIYQQALGNRNV